MLTIEASLVSPDAHGVGPELRLHGARVRSRAAPAGRRAAALRDPGRHPALAPRPPDPARGADRPLRRAALEPHAGAARADRRADPRLRRVVRPLRADRAGGRLRLRRGPRRALLPAVRVPLAALEPARRRVRRLAREPGALPARDRAGDPASAAAPDYPISYRISGEEGADGGFTLDDSTPGLALARRGRSRHDQRLGRELVRAASDDRRRCSSPRGYLLRLARAIKAAVSVPGGRRRPARRSRRSPSGSLADGDADLVASDAA